MILPRNDEFDTDTTNSDINEYRLPAVMRQDEKEVSLFKALIYSTILHPLVVFLIWLLIFILSLVGINLALFQKPKMPNRDIEFVLVDKEGVPINKHTKYRSDRNSRAGGKHDPKRPVSMPQAAAPKGPAKKPQAPAPAKQQSVQQPVKPQPQKPIQQKTVAQPKKQEAPKAQPQKVEPAKTSAPKVQAPKVSNIAPKAPTVTNKPKTDFVIPVPKSAIPQVKQPTTAPIRTAGGSGSGIGSSSGTSKGSGSPSPSFSPSRSGGNGSGAGGGGRFSYGTGSGNGNVGNPGPGNPKGPPGIDAIKEPDFGPYMRELQRRIKMNWDPPKGNESKRVVLLFTISKDGRLLNIKVHRSSGLTSADNAAISAVKLTAPFKPLPAEFRGNSVDIQFTFDYNVFGGSLN